MTLHSDYAERTAPDTVRITRLLPAEPARVWDYLTDPALRRLWLADGAFDLRIGGGFTLVFANSSLTKDDIAAPEKYAAVAERAELTGVVTRCERPNLLAFSWGGDPETASEVEFRLAPEGGGTLLTVTHRRIDARGAMISISSGWHTHLDLLAAQLSGRRHPGFWRQQTALEAEYESRIPD